MKQDEAKAIANLVTWLEAKAKKQAGDDWMAEQGFDRKD